MTLKSSVRLLASAVVYKKESVSILDTRKRGIVMGFRFRKSVNVGGVRFTASKSGVSTSIGGKGFRVTKHANGKVSSTASIPGTGISYTSNLSSSKSFDSKEPEGYYEYSQHTDSSDFQEEDDRPAFLPKEVIDNLNSEAFLAYSNNFLNWAKKLGTNGYYVTSEEFEEVRKIIRYISESTVARQDPNFENNRNAAQRLAEKQREKEATAQQISSKFVTKEVASVSPNSSEIVRPSFLSQEAIRRLNQTAFSNYCDCVFAYAEQIDDNKINITQEEFEALQHIILYINDSKEERLLQLTVKQKVGVLPVLCSVFFFFCMLLSGTFQYPYIALPAFLICLILTLPIPALFSFWERIKLTKNWRIGLICAVFFFGGGLASMDTDQPVSAASASSSVSTISSSQSFAASSTPAAASSSTQEATESSIIVTSSSIPPASSSEVALSVSSEATVLPAASSAAPLETSPESVPVSQEVQKTMVWISDGGTKYHRRSSCSKMKNPQQIELEQAISWGYESCKRCH